MKYLNLCKIEPNIISHKSNKSKIYEKKDIFILHFHNDYEITFSDGNIIEIKDNEIFH